MTDATRPTVRTYQGWQSEKVAFLWGMTGKRAAIVATAVGAGVAPLLLATWSLALILWPVALLLVAVAFVRIVGRTTDEWVVAGLSHAYSTVMKYNRFASGAFNPTNQHVLRLTVPEPEPSETTGTTPDQHATNRSGRWETRGAAHDSTNSTATHDPTTVHSTTNSRGEPARQEAAGRNPDASPGHTKTDHDGDGSDHNSDSGSPCDSGSGDDDESQREKEPQGDSEAQSDNEDDTTAGGERTGEDLADVDEEIVESMVRTGDAPEVSEVDKTRSLDLPGVLAPLEILQHDLPGQQRFGVAYHRIDRTYTAIAHVQFAGIGLIDSDRQEQRISGWGSLLSGLCSDGSPITRIQALQRLVPESGAALRQWHHQHSSPDTPAIVTDTVEGLLDRATIATAQRENYVAITLDARKARSAIKSAGGGHDGALTVLSRYQRAIYSALAGADLQVNGWLTARGIGEVIKSVFDPHAANSLAERRHSHHSEPGVDPASAGPSGCETRPSYYAHEGAYTATFWVDSWPRSQTYATVLGPLLGEGEFRRNLSLHFEPLPPRVAEKEVMRERTSRETAIRIRERTKQVVPEHEKAALQRAIEQDTERAAGHGLVRFSAYVSVTVTDIDDLERACAELEADAAASRIELKRMYLAQDIGFAAACLPFGFGLPTKRW
ncbi:SCO6880 family protein [Haloglycomyces albus]|uniref:SCO6880 family protein n=1 Tax=Haloglycomyces albus TaxID=526067 RepID=UPI00046CE812|nr:SCO6880 family protein [Haloglycomyces albus]